VVVKDPITLQTVRYTTQGWEISRRLGLEMVLRRILSVLVVVLNPDVLILVLRKMFSTSVASNMLTA